MKVVGLAGWSGAGKTTLLTKLIPVFAAQGLRVSTIKHAHHEFDLDRPGKDSWLHREAGAREVVVASAQRFALMHELRGADEPSLHDLISLLAPVELVIVEGYKREMLPKLEIHRAANGKPLLHPQDTAIAAVASDIPLRTTLPVVHLDDIERISELILRIARPAENLSAI